MGNTDRALAEALRWARRNDWRPMHPRTRRDGQYTWTNAVRDPGIRTQSTLRVTVDVSGEVEVLQLMTQRHTTGWVRIAAVRTGCLRAVLDVLAALTVIPIEFSPTFQTRQRELLVGRPRALAALDRAVDSTERMQGDPMPAGAELLDALTAAGYCLARTPK